MVTSGQLPLRFKFGTSEVIFQRTRESEFQQLKATRKRLSPITLRTEATVEEVAIIISSIRGATVKITLQQEN